MLPLCQRLDTSPVSWTNPEIKRIASSIKSALEARSSRIIPQNQRRDMLSEIRGFTRTVKREETDERSGLYCVSRPLTLMSADRRNVGRTKSGTSVPLRLTQQHGTALGLRYSRSPHIFHIANCVPLVPISDANTRKISSVLLKTCFPAEKITVFYSKYQVITRSLLWICTGKAAASKTDLLRL